MVKANGFIGLALAIGVIIVGVHSCDRSDYTKTGSGWQFGPGLSIGWSSKVEGLTRVPPTPRTACFAACLNLPKNEDAQACVTKCDAAHPVLDLDGVTPCPEDSPVIAKKETTATKDNIAKMETTHHPKSKASHAYKSKPHKHHSHHAPSHHGGHGHSGPQKIPSHGAPPHLTGPPPGCR